MSRKSRCKSPFPQISLSLNPTISNHTHGITYAAHKGAPVTQFPRQALMYSQDRHSCIPKTGTLLTVSHFCRIESQYHIFPKSRFLKMPLFQNPAFPKSKFPQIPLSQDSNFPKFQFPKIPLSQIPLYPNPPFQKSHFPQITLSPIPHMGSLMPRTMRLQ